MTSAPDLAAMARAFDGRAATYEQNVWHRRLAERLVALCDLRPGQRVLDAATGTGFVALGAARTVGPSGRVVGVDVSRGMLRVAAAAVGHARLGNVALVEGDACAPDDRVGVGFDVVTCAAGLLYMPVATALAAWHRVLVPGGLVAFTTMKAGSPPGGRLFRECARAFGLTLPDPSAALGSFEACRSALEGAGFEPVELLQETVAFVAEDRAAAWESNLRSPAHAAVGGLDSGQLEAFREAYLAALDDEERVRPGELGRAEVIYAFGRRHGG